MLINNKNKVKSLKRVFFIGCLLLAMIALAFILVDNILVLFICIGVLFLWYLFFKAADFQYIEYSDEDQKIVLRYYPVITFGHKDYGSIELPQTSLYEAEFKKSFFGLVSDLTISIRTKRGIASYPEVSFAAMPREERKLIEDSLRSIIGN